MPIRSDGYSYYIYLPSWLIYHDVTLQGPARACCGGIYPDVAGIRRWPSTGRWLSPHPIGPALMMAPFFVAADLVTRLTRLPRDGFSFFYQHAAGLAGLMYLLLGLAVLRRLLVRHFEPGVALATLVTVTWGTNLFHYGTYDSVFSHAFSFFLITLLAVLTERWWSAPTAARSIALGGVGALVFLTRHTNAITLLLVPLFGIDGKGALGARLSELWARRRALSLMTLTLALGVLPQLLIYRRATGAWFVNPYPGLGLEGDFLFGTTHFFGVLFSTQKGLFFWSPVLLLALPGIFVAHERARSLRLPSTLILAIHTYLIASWSAWQFGGSFGHRAFTDVFGLLALFLAASFTWVAARPRLIPGVATAVCLAVALSVAQMIQYWQGVLPFKDTTWTQYWDAFLRFR